MSGCSDDERVGSWVRDSRQQSLAAIQFLVKPIANV